MNIKNSITLDNSLRVFYHYARWILAWLYYKNPSKDMIVIGITWTKWKSTTTNLVTKWLLDAWKKVFMFSTINYCINGTFYENNSKMTSPSPFLLNKLLAEAKKQWCEYAIIETSSHSIFYNRNYWINYDVVALTNIAQDHLDLHGNMENYVKTKLKLFEKLITYKRKEWIKKVTVINVDSPYSSWFLEQVSDVIYTYWLEKNAQIKAANIKYTKDFTTFEIKMPGNKMNIKTKLKWEFNVYNILATVAILTSQRVSVESMEKTINSVEWIAWRLEEVPNNFWFNIFVDYAHTEDSLKSVLQTLRKMEWIKNIITIFWATWDRDKTKRPKMWKIADDFSDYIILTDDDTYTENSLSIIKDVIPWIKRKEWDRFWIVPDREDAIRTGILMAWENDVVLIAWKWAENIIVTNKWKFPWSDVWIATKILHEIENNKIQK